MNAECEKIREEAHLWRAVLDDDSSAEQRASFQCWIKADPRHAEAFAEAEILWKALEAVPFDESFQVAPKPERYMHIAKQRRFPKRVSSLAIAATVVLAVTLNVAGLWSFTGHKPVVFETGIAEVKTFTLSDGSQVTLGARSRISAVISAKQRNVELEYGDAYFDVEPDKQRAFTVSTSLADVRVTGTEFDVQQQGDMLNVAVAEGAVEVRKPYDVKRWLDTLLDADAKGYDGQSERVELKARQVVSVSHAVGISVPKTVKSKNIGAWRNGQLIYIRATLAEIVDDLNRYLADPIVLAASVRDLKLSGTFYTQNINGLLSTLEAALPVRLIEQKGKRVMVAAP